MSTNRFTNIIGSKRYKLAKDTNTNVQLHLEGDTKPLSDYNVIDIVNQYRVFQEEREASKKYRFNGKFGIYTTNVLSTGSTQYINGIFEDSNWSPLFSTLPPVAPNNWVMQLLYPSTSDFRIPIIARDSGGTQIIASSAYRGLQYETLGVTIINTNRYLTIKGIQNHNLSEGDYIYLYSNFFVNLLQGVYKVKLLGIDGNNPNRDLTLDFEPPPTSTFVGSGNFVKIVNPSYDDLNFNNSLLFASAIASNFTGGTDGGIPYTSDEIRYARILTNAPHNLLVNDFVEIKINGGNSTSIFTGVWRIYAVPNPTQFVIRLDLGVLNKGLPFIIPPANSFYRLLGGTPSEYYIRKFEVLTTNDYSVYPCAFGVNIYPDVADTTLGVVNSEWLFQFNQDLNIERLITNRNGSISELYYAAIKRSGKIPYNWTDVVADWDFNYRTIDVTNKFNEVISFNRPAKIGTIEKFSARTETIDVNGEIKVISGSTYIGDFIDYNSKELLERTAAEIVHSFGSNTQNNNSEFYYYKPFKKLELKKYSNSIETAGPKEIMIDIPGNYETYADGSIAWRDLLTIGYIEEGTNGVDYPFLNGAHYFYFDYNLYLRRQRPPSLLDQSNLRLISNINGEC